MIPIYFQVTCSKVKVKLLFWAQCVVHFINFNPLVTCFYREDKPEFCTMGGIDVSETFLVQVILITWIKHACIMQEIQWVWQYFCVSDLTKATRSPVTTDDLTLLQACEAFEVQSGKVFLQFIMLKHVLSITKKIFRSSE